MKRFKFRLQTLLKLKEHVERERQKEHAESMRHVQEQEGNLQTVERLRISTIDAQRVRQTERLSVAEMLVFTRFLLKLRKDRLTGEELLRGLESKAEKTRACLVEASQQRRMYERLREKKLHRHNEDARLAMTKDSDETAITSFRRRHKND